MKRTTAVLAVFGICVGIGAGIGRAEEADDPLPAGCSLRFGTARFRHGIPVSMMAVSETGKLAVAVNGNHMLGAARAFDLTSGRVLYSLDGWQGLSIEAAALSPDGRTLVTKQDFSLRIRDAVSGDELRKIDLPRATGSYSRNEWVTFTPDGRFIAVTSQGSVIHLIDVESGETIREFANGGPEAGVANGFDTVLNVAISNDGKLLASGGFNNEKDNYFARLWDVETGKELRRFVHGRSYGIEALAFSPDGRTLATGAHDARLRLFDVESGKELKTFPKNGKSRMHGGCVAFSQDGQTVAAAGEALRVYDATTGNELWHLDRRAVGLAFTDGGKTLTGAVMGAIYRWDAATGQPLTPKAGDSIVEQILVSADGSRVVTRGQNGDAHLWDGGTGKHLRYLKATWQRGLAMSPDGKFLVWPVEDAGIRFADPQNPNMSYNGSRITLYDIAGDKLVDRFPGFKGDAHELWFRDEGKTLVTLDHRDGGVRIWNVETGKEQRNFQAAREGEASNAVWRAALSPDGKTLAAAYVVRSGGGRGGRRLGGLGGETHPVRVWDVETGRELYEFDPQTPYILSMAFSPDGQWLVCSGGQGTPGKDRLFVWNMLNSEKSEPPAAAASAVAFSPDGRHLASAGPDGVIRLWTTGTWEHAGEFPGHGGRVTALMFSPNHPVLLSGNLDTTALAWDLGPVLRRE